MCKRVFGTGFVFLFLVLSIGVASAQTQPFIAVYFDQTFQTEAQDPCPGIGVLDTLYVELVNANVFVTGVEFAINYPPELSYLLDFDKQGTVIGSTPTGFSMGWAIPQNGFGVAIDVCKVLVQWTCDGCATIDVELPVVQHPYTGFIGFTDFPNFDLFPAVGLTSLICPTVPTQDTTWGKVKSLYSE